jgi:hypothetical protein
MSARVNRWPGLLGLGLGILLLFAPAGVRAQGGPPLITDDPDTPGPGYWEINFSTLFEKNRRERRFELPRLLLLPTEITLELAHFEINGELGRNFGEHGADGWVYGVSTEANVTRRLELVGELHGERRGAEPTELIVNLGGRQKLTRQLILMLAMGRAVRGAPDERPRLLLFAGLQLNLPGYYKFDQPGGR